MKAKYLSMAALALMGALASCQSDDDFTVARPADAVSVNFSVGSLQATTRSNAIATGDTQRQFNQGDQISVSTPDQEAVIFQCTSTDNQTWSEATAGKFLLWTQPMLTFSAYYPVTDGTSMDAFTLPADQSSVEKIALADYMTRQQVISRPEGGSDIQMQLERKMARVIVNISGFGSQYHDDEKTVSNVRIYSEASGIADGNPTGSSTAIQPYAQGNYDDWSGGWGQNSTFTALVVPGNGDGSSDFIKLSDGEGYNLRVRGIPELEAGKSYTFNLVVGKNRILVQSVTVTDWTTGETLAGGQATEQGAAASGITNPVVGQVIGSDGKNYDAGSTLPGGVNAVAMIAYVNGTSGLAIALADENNGGYMNWATAKSTCENKAEVGSYSWHLPEDAELENMFNANGGYQGLNSKIKTAGGSGLQEGVYYWSSTESGSDDAWLVILSLGDAYWGTRNKGSDYRVRACLAFTCGGEAAAARTLAEATTDDIGKIAGADGKIYDTKAAAEAVATGNAVAMIAYVDGTNGLAIALADENNGNTMNWSTAKSTCEGKSAVTNAAWLLPSLNQLKAMFKAFGDNDASYSGLNTAITNAGGTALQEGGNYWSSTEYNAYVAWYFNSNDGSWNLYNRDLDRLVRACLAF